MTSIGVKELIGIDSRSQSFQRQPKDSKGFICWFFHIFELISSHHTFRFLCGQVSMGRGHRHTLIFLPYTKKGLGKEKCSFRKKCYKSNTISHNFAMLIVFFMLNQPDPQGYLQHTQTQSQNVWDHTIWVSTTDIFSNYRKQVIKLSWMGQTSN